MGRMRARGTMMGATAGLVLAIFVVVGGYGCADPDTSNDLQNSVGSLRPARVEKGKLEGVDPEEGTITLRVDLSAGLSSNAMRQVYQVAPARGRLMDNVM